MKSKKFITNGLENRITLNLINEASRMRYESAKKNIFKFMGRGFSLQY